ncbi:hypothetical protein [Aestuariivirga litoralis]|uniref:hypothetical protein n=1 Tax=Aestuariivirga litoralis TaxID=2650924 RepID=UPI0018C77862|nr:hypothetical protein [Aestuariivirga litoralis]MBG1233004.1 hypothetical protein [Aestuariivirga litoralis]
MNASSKCPHTDTHYNLNLASFGDTNIRYLEITGQCKICKLPLRFRGLPMGMGPAAASMAPDGSEARLPVMFGDEEYDGKAISFDIRQVK